MKRKTWLLLPLITILTSCSFLNEKTYDKVRFSSYAEFVDGLERLTYVGKYLGYKERYYFLASAKEPGETVTYTISGTKADEELSTTNLRFKASTDVFLTYVTQKDGVEIGIVSSVMTSNPDGVEGIYSTYTNGGLTVLGPDEFEPFALYGVRYSIDNKVALDITFKFTGQYELDADFPYQATAEEIVSRATTYQLKESQWESN